ncbi:CPBP family intramembrane glutamic endopeptidase [Haloplanus salinarum]|uniref:CPBP family intramembrane glutamic endopeptidase n=1 Tax=Haloplanus salinarum TaxID=1912324 RepID=UPI00214B0ABE|nr:CPBP family intramembrane glutamic endopeptidase [Haloplanus salinarum]
MPEWAAFAGFVGVVLVGLLVLARASADTLGAPEFPATLTDRVVEAPTDPPPSATLRRPTAPSTPTLLANVVLSQGAFASLLVVGAWLTGVPAAAVGLAADAFARSDILGGIALGVALHVVNAVGSRLTDRFELGDPERLRRAMTPETTVGWVGLLGVVLPLVAGFEELLFRGVLIGAFATGFELSPWLLAGLSSVAFALGHGAQGRLGIVVSGALGFVLAVAFVLTDSLVTVVIAHYLVNTLEFVGGGR